LDEIRDAPLYFSKEPFPKTQDTGYPHIVHRRYDPDAVHDFIGGSRKGMWREYVNTPWIFFDPPGGGDLPPTGPPPDFPEPPPPTSPPPPPPPKTPEGGKGRPGGGGQESDPEPGIPPGIPFDPFDPVPREPSDTPITPGVGGPLVGGVGGSVLGSPGLTGAGLLAGAGGAKTKRPPYGLMGTWGKLMVPGIALQAHPARTAERTEKHNSNPSDDFLEKVKDKLPVTAQIEAFGHEREPGVFVRDEGRQTYTPGTGKGGLFISSPQQGMRNYPDSFRVPDGITESNVDIVLQRETTRLLFGLPDSSIGEGINGVGMFLNSSGNLQVGGVDELGASDESKFVLFNQQVSVQGDAPNLWVWNTNSGTDVDSGYALFAGKTASSNRTMRLKMTHHANNLQELGIFDGTTQVAGITEDSALRLKETAVTPSDVSGWGNFFVKSSDSLPYFRDDSGTEYDLTTSTAGNSFAKITEGRITLGAGGPPIRTGSATSTVVAFTPYEGNQIALYDGSTWALYEFSEITASLPSTTDTIYDMFVYDSSGVTFELVAWSSLSARATAITLQDGVYVKSGDATKKYVGSVSTNGTTGTCANTESERHVWNYYNRKRENVLATVSTASWTYSTSTWRVFAGGTTHVDILIGVIEESIFLQAGIELSSSGSLFAYYVGIGDGTTTTNSAYQQGLGGGSGLSNSGDFCQHISSYHRRPAGIGRRKYYPLEYGGAAAANCLGNYSNLRTTGITGHIFC
ncbi:MAG: hypothetical protein KDD43_00895, partial [Bdellovibrionales bacterium]|nr:hypothetical protein [Bdellovibrionales bacterium]